jgi:hypothetical protein
MLRHGPHWLVDGEHSIQRGPSNLGNEPVGICAHPGDPIPDRLSFEQVDGPVSVDVDADLPLCIDEGEAVVHASTGPSVYWHDVRLPAAHECRRDLP